MFSCANSFKKVEYRPHWYDSFYVELVLSTNPGASYNYFNCGCSCFDSSSTTTDTWCLQGWPHIARLQLPSLRHLSASFWPTETYSVKTYMSFITYVAECTCVISCGNVLAIVLGLYQASKTLNIIFVSITKLNLNTCNYSI